MWASSSRENDGCGKAEFINSVNNKIYDEYKEWLRRSAENSDQVGVIDGWEVPETIF